MIKKYLGLFLGQLINYGIVGHILTQSRALLIEMIVKNKNEHNQLAIILDNMKESLIIIHELRVDFANDTFLNKFGTQIDNSLETPV